jgi:hypothetical protein
MDGTVEFRVFSESTEANTEYTQCLYIFAHNFRTNTNSEKLNFSGIALYFPTVAMFAFCDKLEKGFYSFCCFVHGLFPYIFLNLHTLLPVVH